MVERQELPRVHIRDPVAQRAERAALRIKEGHRADTRHTVAHPGAEAVLAVLILLRLCAQFDRAAAALDGQRRGVLAVFCQKLTEFLNGIQTLPADGGDDVALLESAVLRRTFPIGKADDEHAIGKELNADGLSDGDQLADRPVRRLRRRHCDRGGGKKSKQDRRRSLFCAMRSIHSLTPLKNTGGRRALCAQRAAVRPTPEIFSFSFLFLCPAHLLSALRAKLKGAKF